MSTVDSTVPHYGFHADPETGVAYRTTDFLGFPGYRVGDDGSVWSCRTPGHSAGLNDSWRLLKLMHIGTNLEYRMATFSKGGKLKRVLVHRLVLFAFVGPCPPGTECRHFPDPNPANNRIENLRWDTHVNNLADRIRHGTAPIGERNPRAKLVKTQVEKIRTIYTKNPTKFCIYALSNNYGVSYDCIYDVVKGRTWTVYNPGVNGNPS